MTPWPGCGWPPRPGEALPAALYQRWTAHFGVDILDGIGMTEMLHIFLSNRPGPGPAGHDRESPCPATTCGCSTRTASEVPPGTPGTLFVRGASAATGYWSRYDASRQVFQGEWLRTGDTYVLDADGYYSCLGPHRRHAQGQRHLGLPGRGRGPAAGARRRRPGRRGRRQRHRRAGEAGRLRAAPARAPSADEDELIEFCRAGLPSFKRPRRIVFVTDYPTTATGKIRRVDLRAQAATIMTARARPPIRSLRPGH